MQPFVVLFDGFAQAEQAIVIYGLSDPRTPQAIRYVGQTARPGARYEAHLLDGKRPYNNPRSRWLCSLVKAGVAPTMLLLETVPRADKATEREQHWMDRLRAIGQADLNIAAAHWSHVR